jgi:glycosyltransferase involved in cell wall biosynthesis
VPPRKKTVLAVAENVNLPTGLGTYGKEVLGRLAALDLFDLHVLMTDVEKGDPELLDLPYTVHVADPHGAAACPFGGDAFLPTLLRVKPAAVFTWRDHLQDRFVYRSPLRRHYAYVAMPTVDAEPRPAAEVADVGTADAVLTYTRWGADVLKRAGVSPGRLVGTAAPGLLPVRAAEWPPALRAATEGRFVVGTVQRNQFRKMLPELISGFAGLVAAVGRDRPRLYLHTTWPEPNGFNLPRDLRDAGVLALALFTYKCGGCAAWWPAPFQGATVPCRACAHGTAAMPSPRPGTGLDRAQLAAVYDAMDVYCHFATNEGFGMPLLEAAGRGRFLVGIDHTATGELLRDLGVPEAFRLRPSLREEAAAGRHLAHIGADAIASTLRAAYELHPEDRFALGRKAAAAAAAAYSYDAAAQKWADILTGVQPKAAWDAPQRFAPDPPPGAAGAPPHAWEFARACHAAVPGATAYDAAAAADNVSQAVLSRDDVRRRCAEVVSEYNYWEAQRLREAAGEPSCTLLGAVL